MPEVQIPVLSVPEHGLKDYEIENRQEVLTVQDHFDRWEKEMVGPPTYIYSETPSTPRETVKAPIIASEALSYDQQLQEGVNNTPEKELINGIDQTGINIVAARHMYVLVA